MSGVFALATSSVHATPAEPIDCAAAAAFVEAETGLPARLLYAIGQVETGRLVPGTNRIEPWPWSANMAGQDYVFASKEAAVAWTAAQLQDGHRSIDVGCFQINLMYHPAAFATLDDAFDPLANARYAAAFLFELHQRSGGWQIAAAEYHSSDPDLGEPYRRRVFEFMGNPLFDGGAHASAAGATQSGAGFSGATRYGRRVALGAPRPPSRFGMRVYTPAWAAVPAAVARVAHARTELASLPVDLVVLRLGPARGFRFWPRIVRPN